MGMRATKKLSAGLCTVSGLTTCSRFYLVLVPLSVLLIGVALASLRWRMELDPPLFLYFAYLIDKHGYVPYRDFFDVNMLGTHFVYVLIGRAIGYVSDLKFHILNLVYFSLIAASTWLWLKKLGRKVAWGAIILFGLYYFGSGFILIMQREYLLLLPIIVAVLLATSFPSINDYFRSFIIGFLFALATTIKPHSPIGLPLVLVALLFEIRERSQGQGFTWKRIVLIGVVAAIGFGMPILGMLAYLLATNALPYFLDIATHYWPLYSGVTNSFVIIRGPQHVSYLLDTYLTFDDQILWFMPAATGVMVSLFPSILDGAQKRQILVMVSLTATYSIYPVLSGQFFQYHWLPFMYFLLALCSLCFLELPADAVPFAQWFPTFVLVTALLFRPDFLSAPLQEIRQFVAGSPVAPPRGGRVDGIADYLRTHMQPGDRVQPLDWGDSVLHALLLARAQGATRFMYDIMFFHDVSEPYIQDLRRQFVIEFAETRPRYVIEVAGNPFIQGPYTISGFLEFQLLMAADYATAYSGGTYVIFERTPLWDADLHHTLIIYPFGQNALSAWFPEHTNIDVMALEANTPLDTTRLSSQLDDSSRPPQLITLVSFTETVPDILRQWANNSLFWLDERWSWRAHAVDYLYGPPECFLTIPQDHNFGNLITLEAASGAWMAMNGKQFACVRLEWQAVGSIPDSYKVSVHIINSNGEMVAQHDGIPAGYSAPTNTWMPRQLVVDQFAIPLPDGVSPGRYKLQILVYKENSGERLRLVEMSGRPDSVIVGEITIPDQ